MWKEEEERGNYKKRGEEGRTGSEKGQQERLSEKIMKEKEGEMTEERRVICSRGQQGEK